MKCRYCGKECKNKNSLIQHEIRCKENPNKISIITTNFNKYNEDVKSGKRHSTNQYIKAKENDIDLKMSDNTKQKISKKLLNRNLSEEHKRNIAKGIHKAIKNHPESYCSSNVNGRVKHRKYNGITLDSTWEVEVAKYLDENNIKWERVINGFPYIFENSEHLYFPDFYLVDYDYYIEVKGYERVRDTIKYNVLNNLIIIKQKEINKIKRKDYNIFDYI